MFVARYRDDIANAIKRVDLAPSETLKTPEGNIEYARTGTGPSVLMSHGIFGSHVEGLDMVHEYVGSGFDAIAPSRFGYLGTTLPHGASAAMQADAYVRLLDHLGVDRVAAVGYSAGSTSVIELALRHPDRVDVVVLLAANLPGATLPPRIFHPPMRAALRWQFGFWALRQLMPGAFTRMLGVPSDYHPTADEQRVIEDVARSIQPIELRARGAVFDAFVSNPGVNLCALEDVRIPTLLVHSVDDSLATYDHAVEANARIPGSRLVTMRRGGHLFLGHSHLVRREVGVFIRELVLHDIVAAGRGRVEGHSGNGPEGSLDRGSALVTSGHRRTKGAS